MHLRLTAIGFVLFVVVLFVGWYIYKSQTLRLTPYQFIDEPQDGIFIAHGTWLNPATDLPVQPQTTFEIICRKDLNYCYGADGTISDHFFSVDSFLYQIDRWTGELITTKPDIRACNQSIIKIDRVGKKVFNLVTGEFNTNEMCKMFAGALPELVLGEGNHY